MSVSDFVLLALITALAAYPLANYIGWWTLGKVGRPYPFNWRVLIAPSMYFKWLDNKED